MSAIPAISIRGLDFRYREGGFRLRVDALEVAPAQTVAVTGPSGTGKTTLLHLIAGIMKPDAGIILAGAGEVSSLTDAARRRHRIRNIGLVFQEFELISYLDVLDNILLPYRLDPGLQLDRAASDRALALVKEVGLGDKVRRRVTQLSQGERQRVAIARALVTGGQLVMADEPTGNLDPRNKKRILDLLFDQVKARGITLVAVTHDHSLLDRFDRVIDFASLGVEA